jgi:hypothetical protein
VGFASFATAAAVYPRPLTSDIIFPALSLFMLVQFPIAMVCVLEPVKFWYLNMISQFATVTSNVIEAWVSVKRLSKFLKSEELQTDARTVSLKTRLGEGDVVSTYVLLKRVVGINPDEFLRYLKSRMENLHGRVMRRRRPWKVSMLQYGKVNSLVCTDVSERARYARLSVF